MTLDNRLMRVVNIRSIVLVDLKASTKWTPDTLPLDRPFFRLHYSANAVDKADDAVVEVLATLVVEEEVEEGQESSLSVEATYRLTYERPESCLPTAQELKHFAERNGVFNAWPYWRELSHSTFQRMGFPLPPIPLFRVPGGVHSGGGVHQERAVAGD